MNKNFDYIIVGAGSSGCVLANRLSEDEGVSVLLLEAGGPDYRFDFRTQMPAALAFPLQGKRYNWAFKTDLEPHMNNREMDCGRGKGLGGSSLINGMCYIRGNPMDFNAWAERPGLSDWAYRNILPYYKKCESRDIGGNDYHGGDGPVAVTTPKKGNNELFQAMIDAGVEAGYPRTEDLNGYQQEGFGPMDRFVTPRGRRSSSSRGYLDRAKHREHLTIQTHAAVERVLFDGTKATGVEVSIKGVKTTFTCNKEVIISAGAILSPAILQRSGVGPQEWLEELGIDVVCDLWGVGNNLQDHLELYIQYECKKPVSIAPALKWYNKPPIGFKWLFFGKGLGASNQFRHAGRTAGQQEQRHVFRRYNGPRQWTRPIVRPIRKPPIRRSQQREAKARHRGPQYRCVDARLLGAKIADRRCEFSHVRHLALLVRRQCQHRHGPEQKQRQQRDDEVRIVVMLQHDRFARDDPAARQMAPEPVGARDQRGEIPIVARRQERRSPAMADCPSPNDIG